MAGEVIRAFGTPVTLEANGGTIANNAITQANDDSYATETDGAGYPHARFVLTFAYASAPTEGTTLSLVARLLNISSTNDAEVPEFTRQDRFIGEFRVNNVTSTQYAELFAFDLPIEADYYIANNGTGQTVSAGWTLTVIPMTYTTAP
jgi:hypothetical protein